MALLYFLTTVGIMIVFADQVPAAIATVLNSAFTPTAAQGGFLGATVMLAMRSGVARGVFSNESGLGSAPIVAAAAKTKWAAEQGLISMTGTFIDTIVICSCTAFILLLVPEELTRGLMGMELLQTAMNYHLGSFGVIFVAVILALFSFSTFLGILFYARSNVSYLFGNRWLWQTLYKILALIMLFIGGIQAYTVVWDLGDVGIGLMTIFNLAVLFPLSNEALSALAEYEKKKKYE